MAGWAGIAIVIGATAWLGFGRLLLRRWPWSGPHGTVTALDVTKLALAVVAGVGGVVALTVAYRRQRDLEGGLFAERFRAAASQLGDPSPAVRLAGVYAMAGVADESPRDRRQQCIDVLCAYLRLPYLADPGQGQLSEVVSTHSWTTGSAQAHEQRTYQLRPNDREIRHSIIRVIRDHLQDGVPTSWQGHDFNFTAAIFDGGDFSYANFSGGRVSFNNATFSGDFVNFTGAKFSGGRVTFNNATFSSGLVDFSGAKFSGGIVTFMVATFSGAMVWFDVATFSGGEVGFDVATFSGSLLTFNGAAFRGGEVTFVGAKFPGGKVAFIGATFSGSQVSFNSTTFSGGRVTFDCATFSGGLLTFQDATSSAGLVTFDRATFSGGRVTFEGATFSKGLVMRDGKEFRGLTT